MRKRELPPALRLTTPERTERIAAAQLWKRHPELMDYLQPSSPLQERRRFQRELYERAFAPHYSSLRRGIRVLDVGCGIGRFLLPLADRGCLVWGVDSEPLQLRAAQRYLRKKRRSGAAVARAHAERLPFGNAAFDAVLAIETFSYVSSFRRALAEVRRVLRPGGLLFLSVESLYGGILASPHIRLHLVPSILKRRFAHVPGVFFTRYFREKELRRHLASAGFRILNLVPCHYVLDGPLEFLVRSDRELRRKAERTTLRSVETSMANAPALRKLARTFTVVAQADASSLAGIHRGC